MVLLHDIVYVFYLSQPRSAPQLTIRHHFGSGFWIGRTLVDGDGARVHRVRLRQRLAEERLRPPDNGWP
jgi:hypothetical protein